MRIPKLALLALLIIGYVVWVLSLAAQLRAETARYEYRAQPEGEPKPLLIPCFVLDRFNYLCIETGEIFVDVAAGRNFVAPLIAFRQSEPSWASRHASRARTLTGKPAAAAPRIILAHQKLASDAWVDRTKNKKGERCCDANKDCHSLNPDEVKHVPGGVDIRLGDQTIHIPGEEIMPSEDGRYWVCYWGDKVRCFFAPYSGS